MTLLIFAHNVKLDIAELGKLKLWLPTELKQFINNLHGDEDGEASGKWVGVYVQRLQAPWDPGGSMRVVHGLLAVACPSRSSRGDECHEWDT